MATESPNESTVDRLRMLDAIDAAWRDSMTPPELRTACLAFHTDGRRHVDHFRAVLLITIGTWIIEGAEHGHDRHMLEQVAAAEAHRCVAMLMRDAKERRGEPFVPARMAIVAFAIAEGVAHTEPFKCDVDGAVDAFWADSPDSKSQGDEEGA